MQSRWKVFVASAGSLLLATAAVQAHHAFSAEFDAAKPVELRGVVTRMEWINPHSWITIDVSTEDGAVETWEIEVGAPNAMFRRGFTRDSLPVGTEIVVRGYQARDGGQRANGRDLTLADGQRLFLGGSNPESAEEDP